MGKVTTSGQNNITSPNGNSLAVFIDGVTEEMRVKDVMGNIQPLSDFTGCKSPFKYNSNGNGIEPILGTNNASGNYSTIGGGVGNISCRVVSTIGGGCLNLASGERSTIGGGVCNITSQGLSVVSGGGGNTASQYYATVGGGAINTASNYYSTVGGGKNNTSSGCNSTIGGGFNNTASSQYSAILGGHCNIVGGYKSIIGGGYCNNLSGGEYSSIIGGRLNNSNGYDNVHLIGSILTATQPNTTFTNCISAENLTAGCFVVVAPNGVLTNAPTTPYAGSIFQIGAGTGSTERCGLANNAQGNYSVVTGGKFNCAFGNFSTISGGICNCTYSNFDTIAGGQHNVTCANQSIIGGGSYNTTNGNDSTIAGGRCNVTMGNYSIIGGGYKNNSNASNSIVGGGSCNSATCEHSFIGGGYSNLACATHAIVIGGESNVSSGSFSIIGGGSNNTASAINSSILGGTNNTVIGCWSNVGGGCCNVANGCFSSILGGVSNNTCTFANAMIVGSNLCATQACTTFMNCASLNNLTVGCFVQVGVNKVLENNAIKPNFGLFAQTTDSTPVTATAVESSLIGVGVGTLSVPANGFSIGDSFNANLDGVISCLGTATLEIRIKTLSGALLADTGIINMDASTLKAWTLSLQFTIRTLGATGVASISSGGLFSYIKNAGTNFEGFVLSTVNTTTFDTTINNTLVITAQWNTNNAGNSIFSRNFTLNKIF